MLLSSLNTFTSLDSQRTLSKESLQFNWEKPPPQIDSAPSRLHNISSNSWSRRRKVTIFSSLSDLSFGCEQAGGVAMLFPFLSSLEEIQERLDCIGCVCHFLSVSVHDSPRNGGEEVIRAGPNTLPSSS